MNQPGSLMYAVLGVATITLALLLCAVGFLCILYVLFFRFKTHHCNLFALREFNSFWSIRILLVVFGVLWSLTELARLPLLRFNGWNLSAAGFQTQASLCKGYLVVSQGIMEPCFYLTALFLVHGSVYDECCFGSRKRAKAKAVLNIVVFCFPVFLLQLFVVLFGPSLQRKHSGFFFSGDALSSYKRVHDGAGHDVAWCTYPLWSTIILASFGFLYIAYFMYVCWRMVSLAINKRLQVRVYGLVLAMVLFLPVQVTILFFTFKKRITGKFEVLSFLAFVMTVMTTVLGEGILVIRPITDALAVRSVSHCNNEESPCGKNDTVSVEMFSGTHLAREGEDTLLLRKSNKDESFH